MISGSTKDRIVEAAVGLFNERWDGGGLDEPHRQGAGISPGNLYYHYGNKEEIIRAIYDRMIAEWGEVWTPPEDRVFDLGYLRVVLEENFSLQWKYRFFYRETIALMRRDPELARRYQAVQQERVKEQELFLDHFVEAGIVRRPEDPDAFNALVKVGWIVATNWLSFLETGGERVEAKKMEEGVDLIMQILRPYLTEEALAESGGPTTDNNNI